MITKNRIFLLAFGVCLGIFFESLDFNLIGTVILLFVLYTLLYEVDKYNNKKKQKLNKFIKDIQEGKNVNEAIDNF